MCPGVQRKIDPGTHVIRRHVGLPKEQTATGRYYEIQAHLVSTVAVTVAVLALANEMLRLTRRSAVNPQVHAHRQVATEADVRVIGHLNELVRTIEAKSLGDQACRKCRAVF